MVKPIKTSLPRGQNLESFLDELKDNKVRHYIKAAQRSPRGFGLELLTYTEEQRQDLLNRGIVTESNHYRFRPRMTFVSVLNHTLNEEHDDDLRLFMATHGTIYEERRVERTLADGFKYLTGTVVFAFTHLRTHIPWYHTVGGHRIRIIYTGQPSLEEFEQEQQQPQMEEQNEHQEEHDPTYAGILKGATRLQYKVQRNPNPNPLSVGYWGHRMSIINRANGKLMGPVTEGEVRYILHESSRLARDDNDILSYRNMQAPSENWEGGRMADPLQGLTHIFEREENEEELEEQQIDFNINNEDENTEQEPPPIPKENELKGSSSTPPPTQTSESDFIDDAQRQSITPSEIQMPSPLLITPNDGVEDQTQNTPSKSQTTQLSVNTETPEVINITTPIVEETQMDSITESQTNEKQNSDEENKTQETHSTEENKTQETHSTEEHNPGHSTEEKPTPENELHNAQRCKRKSKNKINDTPDTDEHKTLKKLRDQLILNFKLNNKKDLTVSTKINGDLKQRVMSYLLFFIHGRYSEAKKDIGTARATELWRRMTRPPSLRSSPIMRAYNVLNM